MTCFVKRSTDRPHHPLTHSRTHSLTHSHSLLTGFPHAHCNRSNRQTWVWNMCKYTKHISHYSCALDKWKTKCAGRLNSIFTDGGADIHTTNGWSSTRQEDESLHSNMLRIQVCICYKFHMESHWIVNPIYIHLVHACIYHLIHISLCIANSWCFSAAAARSSIDIFCFTNHNHTHDARIWNTISNGLCVCVYVSVYGFNFEKKSLLLLISPFFRTKPTNILHNFYFHNFDDEPINKLLWIYLETEKCTNSIWPKRTEKKCMNFSLLWF